MSAFCAASVRRRRLWHARSGRSSRRAAVRACCSRARCRRRRRTPSCTAVRTSDEGDRRHGSGGDMNYDLAVMALDGLARGTIEGRLAYDGATIEERAASMKDLAQICVRLAAEPDGDRALELEP